MVCKSSPFLSCLLRRAGHLVLCPAAACGAGSVACYGSNLWSQGGGIPTLSTCSSGRPRSKYPGWPGKTQNPTRMPLCPCLSNLLRCTSVPGSSRDGKHLFGLMEVTSGVSLCLRRLFCPPSSLLAAQASLQSPYAQEDSSGSQTFLVSVSNVQVCVDVRMLKMIHIHMRIHRNLSCRICAGRRDVFLSGEGGIAALLLSAFSPLPSHRAGLSWVVWCTTKVLWSRVTWGQSPVDRTARVLSR